MATSKNTPQPDLQFLVSHISTECQLPGLKCWRLVQYENEIPGGQEPIALTDCSLCSLVCFVEGMSVICDQSPVQTYNPTSIKQTY